jgi:hypothetical protein
MQVIDQVTWHCLVARMMNPLPLDHFRPSGRRIHLIRGVPLGALLFKRNKSERREKGAGNQLTKLESAEAFARFKPSTGPRTRKTTTTIRAAHSRWYEFIKSHYCSARHSPSRMYFYSNLICLFLCGFTSYRLTIKRDLEADKHRESLSPLLPCSLSHLSALLFPPLIFFLICFPPKASSDVECAICLENWPPRCV